jgi:hypothetical protein
MYTNKTKEMLRLTVTNSTPYVLHKKTVDFVA